MQHLRLTNTFSSSCRFCQFSWSRVWTHP